MPQMRRENMLEELKAIKIGMWYSHSHGFCAKQVLCKIAQKLFCAIRPGFNNLFIQTVIPQHYCFCNRPDFNKIENKFNV